MRQPIRVLLVEDNPGDADLTRETLEDGTERVDLTVVVDGAQALSYLRGESPFERARTPDLILLDLNLPKLDGRRVLEGIKREERLRKIPVVVLTSSDAEQDILRSYELGANCFVTKPVGFDAYQSIVRAVEDFWCSIVKLP